MAEQYDVAAWRHHSVAEKLEEAGDLDDAGYHFGVCGETAVKQALRASGVEANWIAAGISLKRTPMLQHFPTLTTFVTRSRNDIAVFAVGRHAAPITGIILDVSFLQRFSGWHINIRYADLSYTPVSSGICGAWHQDADELILGLLL